MKNVIFIVVTAALMALSACNDNKPHTKLINIKAGLPATFHFNNLGLKVMASFISKKTGSMSVLYANRIALSHTAKGGTQHTAGEVLALISWQQQNDDHWFGANIPGPLLSAELIKTNNEKGHLSISYKKYVGQHLLPSLDTLGQNARINYIFNQQPSIMP